MNSEDYPEKYVHRFRVLFCLWSYYEIIRKANAYKGYLTT